MESMKEVEELNAIYNKIHEETPAERIDRISKSKVAQRSAAAKADADKKAASAKKFQAHKKDVISKGGRPVDALDSWQKKKLNAGDNTFDIVKDYLIETGHAVDEKEAEYVMSNLDQKMIDDILKI